MFGCCCSSSNRKSSIFAAALVLAGAVGWVLFSNSTGRTTRTDAAQTATTPEAEIIPSHFAQPEDPMGGDPMAAFAEWGKLAPEHEVLTTMLGTWDCTTKFWMGGPEPIVGKGTSTGESLLDGRFVTQHFVMPEFMGGAYEGIGTFGYDKQKGKFVSTWLDTMSTGMNPMEGTWDEDTQTMTWTGTSISPMGKSKMKNIVKVIDEDNSFMEFWEASDKTDGEFVKIGEITYTRRK